MWRQLQQQSTLLLLQTYTERLPVIERVAPVPGDTDIVPAPAVYDYMATTDVSDSRCLSKLERQLCHAGEELNMTSPTLFVLVPAPSLCLSASIVSICSCRDCVELPTLVGALRIACSGLCAAARFHTADDNQGCRLAALKYLPDLVRPPLLSVALALLKVCSAPLSSMISCSNSLFAARESASSLRDYWTRLLRP